MLPSGRCVGRGLLIAIVGAMRATAGFGPAVVCLALPNLHVEVHAGISAPFLYTTAVYSFVPYGPSIELITVSRTFPWT